MLSVETSPCERLVGILRGACRYAACEEILVLAFLAAQEGPRSRAQIAAGCGFERRKLRRILCRLGVRGVLSVDREGVRLLATAPLGTLYSLAAACVREIQQEHPDYVLEYLLDHPLGGEDAANLCHYLIRLQENRDRAVIH